MFLSACLEKTTDGWAAAEEETLKKRNSTSSYSSTHHHVRDGSQMKTTFEICLQRMR